MCYQSFLSSLSVLMGSDTSTDNFAAAASAAASEDVSALACLSCGFTFKVLVWLCRGHPNLSACYYCFVLPISSFLNWQMANSKNDKTVQESMITSID